MMIKLLALGIMTGVGIVIGPNYMTNKAAFCHFISHFIYDVSKIRRVTDWQGRINIL